jgi:hypothetical protein
LRYLRDPQLQRNVHRSQNRLEAYHQLRAALAQIGGRKQLIGRALLQKLGVCEDSVPTVWDRVQL